MIVNRVQWWRWVDQSANAAHGLHLPRQRLLAAENVAVCACHFDACANIFQRAAFQRSDRYGVHAAHTALLARWGNAPTQLQSGERQNLSFTRAHCQGPTRRRPLEFPVSWACVMARASY